MNEETAKNILEAHAWMSLSIDKLAQHILDLPPGEERDRLIKLFKGIFNSFDDVMRHVVGQYRHLDPFGAGEDWYFSLKQKYETVDYPARKLSDEEKAAAEKAGLEAAAEIAKDMKSNDSE